MSEEHVVISGASSGIGRTIAEKLAAEGYRVTGTSRWPGKMAGINNGVQYEELDLRHSKSIVAFVKRVAVPDILINNAGVCQFGALEEVPMEKYRELFEVNLFGLINLTRAYLPAMVNKGKGTIINIGSLAGLFPLPFQSAYVASKFAVAGFTQSLRMDVQHFGIKVVLVEPGDIKSGMTPEIFSKKGSVYRPFMHSAMLTQEKSQLSAPPPLLVAEAVRKLLCVHKPKPIIRVGRGIIPFLIAKRLLPKQVVEHITLWHYKQLNGVAAG